MASTEYQLERALDLLEEQRTDPWGHHAAVVARGMRESGLAESVDQSMSVLAATFTGGLDGVQAGLRRVTVEVARSNEVLAAVHRAVSSPLSTAADERLRRGVNALEKGWLPEAVRELTESVAADPYPASSQWVLAYALSQTGDVSEAGMHYGLAARYATEDELHLAAGAGMLGALALEEAGRHADAAELLELASRRVPACPELLLALARSTGDTSATQRALAIAPDLAVHALAIGVPGVEATSETLVGSTDGVVESVYQAYNRYEALESELGRRVSPLLPRENVPEVMTAVGAWLKTVPRLRQECELSPGWDFVPSVAVSQAQVDIAYGRVTGIQREMTKRLVGLALIVIGLVLAFGVGCGALFSDSVGGGGVFALYFFGLILTVGGVVLRRTSDVENIEESRRALMNLQQDRTNQLTKRAEAEKTLPGRRAVAEHKQALRSALDGLPPHRVTALGVGSET